MEREEENNKREGREVGKRGEEGGGREVGKRGEEGGGREVGKRGEEGGKWGKKERREGSGEKRRGGREVEKRKKGRYNVASVVRKRYPGSLADLCNGVWADIHHSTEKG